jgi:uncharacterized protein (DUF305 family)
MQRPLAFALILALATLFTGCARRDASQDVRSGTSSGELERTKGREPKSGTAASETPREPAADADLTFIDTMSRHHQDDVALARLAASEASRAELQEFASGLLANRERRVALMKEWRDQWYAGRAAAVNSNLPGMSRMTTGPLEGLSGAAWDDKFLDMMLEHGKGGVTMAAGTLEKLSHPELKALCQQIADEGAKEVARMTEWKVGPTGAAPPDTGGPR